MYLHTNIAHVCTYAGVPFYSNYKNRPFFYNKVSYVLSFYFN